MKPATSPSASSAAGWPTPFVDPETGEEIVGVNEEITEAMAGTICEAT